MLLGGLAKVENEATTLTQEVHHGLSKDPTTGFIIVDTPKL